VANPTYTIQDIALRLIQTTAADTDIGLPTAAIWVERRLRELSDRTHLRFLRNIAEVTYPSPLFDEQQGYGGQGTVSVTFGSQEVVGTGTVFTNQLIGWYGRFQNNWYRINDVQESTQTLILESQYCETNGTSSPVGFTILQRYLPLRQNVRWIGSMVHERMFHMLRERTQQWFDARYPARLLVASFPVAWAEGPAYHGDYPGSASSTFDGGIFGGDDRRKTIETYPPSSQQEVFKYFYWETLPRMELTSIIPPEVDPFMLYEGAKIDLYEYRTNKALMASTPQAEVAQMYQKMGMTAMKVWEEALSLAVTTDTIQLSEDVELWSGFDEVTDEDINPEWDNYVSRFGIITVR
jgi:hypothetical protein